MKKILKKDSWSSVARGSEAKVNVAPIRGMAACAILPVTLAAIVSSGGFKIRVEAPWPLDLKHCATNLPEAVS